jgi:signal transduction histidine kinase/CHASE3 domain sensor protein
LVFGPAIVVVIVGALAYASQQREAAMSGQVIHTRDVLGTAAELMNALLTAESAQRGFIITRDSGMLGAYEAARPEVESLLPRLRALTIDNPAQQRRIDSLDDIVHRRLARLDTVLHETDGGQSIAPVQVTGRGPRLMDQIRRLVQEVDVDENRLLAERRQREREAGALSGILLVLGTIVAAVLAFLVNRNMDRALADRRRALSDSEATNSRLQEQTVALERQAAAATQAARDAQRATAEATAARLAAEESERRTERLQAATEALSSALSFAEVASLIVDQAIAALRADSGVVVAAELDHDQIRIVASRHVSVAPVGTVVPLSRDLPLCKVVRTGEPIIAPSRDEVREQFPAIAEHHQVDGARAIAAFPLRRDERVLGALLVRWNHDRVIPPGEAAFMTALARIAAETMDRARLFEAERDARTAAEAANRAKAAFLASMSHELRTPLQAALGFAQLVRSGLYGPVNDRQAEVLSRVERSQTHLARLIDDVLDFARLEAGRVRVELAPVALADVIADLAPLVEPQAAKKNIELSLLPPPESLRVMADRQRLQQVLVNLVGNAIKFTPDGGSVRVGALRDGTSAAIRVRDTGPGIPPDRLQAIFEPFVQVEDGLTRTQPGAGLGLAISRDLARAMHGELSVESALGEGSTFILTLPIVDD